MVTKQQTTLPPQHQTRQPGLQSEMNPQPVTIKDTYRGSGRLENKVAIISGGDSGIGRAVAVHFAKEGADVAIVYLNEHKDAEETKRLVEQEGRRCLAIAGDIGDEAFCKEAVKQTVETFGKLDIVVNNAAEQHPQPNLLNITAAQLEKTFRTNVFGYFFLTKAALPHLKNGSTIINTASVTAYEGNEQLIDYSATKGAIVAFTRSLAKALVGQGIRVNGVAPGPIWTPLIPSTFKSEQVATFGANTPMKRPGQPSEVAPCYVFLASDESSYMIGQILHVDGGKFVSG
ncbi:MULTISPECIES: SDR family oxidoreductase [Geobacillus]|jgi:NAD(P)-dependent dehydrogenase (short-subunit alcohol dehydrogenase family)|uniref:Oxidoreductase (Short-chain hydrogenase:reductase family) n=1 Tax=Geobacillus thermodenitrificans (strain NG80-2) TaxID=420246 RepID=A4IKZ8_GEOTN|nr:MULTISPECIES: SDR family oxidoreductase [Geobacillus]ABO66002.1 Oxidoreductase (short-chain hydrogenase:reductase family) [Geobacillus thermodenitrificans NG80-2]ARP41733.1 putative oxidoreductase YhxC [Geobacillus thermodenitrificans]MED0664090.1 NAD(P)-dependent oxidoreductase [Geobacillus thermodenitrificans]NNU86753.1 glucose 1-dehydrogenase [Geobacillus sp. MR]OQP11414.1 NAD(P)-dependent oxidoreductase [Geobacillus sp. 47C-IIb]